MPSTDTGLAKKNEQLWDVRIKMARLSPWHFLKHFFFTKDEHDFTIAEKPFPAKAYQRILCRATEEYKVLFIKKSRQIMLTWEMAGLLLHDAMFKPNRLNMVQSRKEDDAAKVLDRMRHAYDALLHKGFPDLPRAKRTGEKTGTSTKLNFPDNKSDIQAIAQGENIIRMNTCSRIFGDEINHQPEGEASYGAAKPTIDGGGSYVGAGTANGPNWVHRLMNNIDDQTLEVTGGNTVDSRTILKKRFEPDTKLSLEEQRHWIERTILALTDEEFGEIPFEELVACVPGVDFWMTNNGFACMWIHYTADPDKDPITTNGREWFDNYRPGWKEDAWEREMEGSVHTFRGRKVIQNWSRDMFVKPTTYDYKLPLELSVDFGTGVCCAHFSQLHRIEGTNAKQTQFLDEIVLRGVSANTPTLAKKIVQKIKGRFYESWQSGNIKTYPDPAGNQPRETTADASKRTSIKILENHGLRCRSKMIGVAESTELVKNVFGIMYPNGEVAVKIDPRCEYLIGVCGGGWHYPDKDDAEHVGKPEKDGYWDHGGDNIRYMISNQWNPKDFGIENQPRNYIIKVIRRRSTGEVIGRRKIPLNGRRSANA